MKLTESPVERLKKIGLQMVSSPTLPNIVLGGALGSTIVNVDFGIWYYKVTNLQDVILFWIAYALSVLLYTIGDELHALYQEAEDALDNTQDKGIQ